MNGLDDVTGTTSRSIIGALNQPRRPISRSFAKCYPTPLVVTELYEPPIGFTMDYMVNVPRLSYRSWVSDSRAGDAFKMKMVADSV